MYEHTHKQREIAFEELEVIFMNTATSEKKGMDIDGTGKL